MYFPNSIIADVDGVARVSYIDRKVTKLWNDNRRGDELRLLTGWAWTAKDGSDYRLGFKTVSVAYRDAYYTLCRREAAPGPLRRLRLVPRVA